MSGEVLEQDQPMRCFAEYSPSHYKGWGSLFKVYLTPLSSLFNQRSPFAARTSFGRDFSSSGPRCLKSHLLWTRLLPASSKRLWLCPPPSNPLL